MAQKIGKGDPLMFSLISSQSNLEKILSSFINEYAKKNHINQTIEYEDVLHSCSAFVIKPDWTTTRFLNKEHAKELIPTYLDKREQYLAKDNLISDLFIHQELLTHLYSNLMKSHPKIGMFCDKLIKIILVAELNNYIEGTTAEELGIAHLDFKKHYNQEDFNELIVHQITHMLLFIDDYINPQVSDHNKNILIPTPAVHKRGGNGFPFYILFHSVCVGVEVLAYRVENNSLNRVVNYHPNTELAIRRCQSGMNILNKNIELFTDNGKNILFQYAELLQNSLIREACVE